MPRQRLGVQRAFEGDAGIAGMRGRIPALWGERSAGGVGLGRGRLGKPGPGLARQIVPARSGRWADVSHRRRHLETDLRLSREDDRDDAPDSVAEVDPERDTREVLADYVSWAPGVTGSPDEIEKAIEAFRIYASKVPLDEGEYTMEHSAMVLLFDENGRFFESIGYHEDFDRAVDKIRRLMAG